MVSSFIYSRPESFQSSNDASKEAPLIKEDEEIAKKFDEIVTSFIMQGGPPTPPSNDDSNNTSSNIQLDEDQIVEEESIENQHQEVEELVTSFIGKEDEQPGKEELLSAHMNEIVDSFINDHHSISADQYYKQLEEQKEEPPATQYSLSEQTETTQEMASETVVDVSNEATKNEQENEESSIDIKEDEEPKHDDENDKTTENKEESELHEVITAAFIDKHNLANLEHSQLIKEGENEATPPPTPVGLLRTAQEFHFEQEEQHHKEEEMKSDDSEMVHEDVNLCEQDYESIQEIVTSFVNEHAKSAVVQEEEKLEEKLEEKPEHEPEIIEPQHDDDAIKEKFNQVVDSFIGTKPEFEAKVEPPKEEERTEEQIQIDYSAVDDQKSAVQIAEIVNSFIGSKPTTIAERRVHEDDDETEEISKKQDIKDEPQAENKEVESEKAQEKENIILTASNEVDKESSPINEIADSVLEHDDYQHEEEKEQEEISQQSMITDLNEKYQIVEHLQEQIREVEAQKSVDQIVTSFIEPERGDEIKKENEIIIESPRLEGVIQSFVGDHSETDVLIYSIEPPLSSIKTEEDETAGIKKEEEHHHEQQESVNEIVDSFIEKEQSEIDHHEKEEAQEYVDQIVTAFIQPESENELIEHNEVFEEMPHLEGVIQVGSKQPEHSETSPVLMCPIEPLSSIKKEEEETPEIKIEKEHHHEQEILNEIVDSFIEKKQSEKDHHEKEEAKNITQEYVDQIVTSFIQPELEHKEDVESFVGSKTDHSETSPVLMCSIETLSSTKQKRKKHLKLKKSNKKLLMRLWTHF